ncbi:MAG: hypothetical protein H4O13_09600 [Xanthomonadales bacterium]|nr:hypothetical protein [Xanthomonadales bacterium]
MAKPRISWLRTLGLTLALALPVAAALYLEREFRPAAEVGDSESLLPEPWLELPGEPQQLAFPQTRRDLLDFMIMERTLSSAPKAPNQDLYESLAFDCDEVHQIQGVDVLQLWWVSAFGGGTKLELRVRGRLADLELGEWESMTPPPPPPSPAIDDMAYGHSLRVEPQRRQLRGIPLEQLETARSAWTSEALWTTSRSHHVPSCIDGDAAIVSGCVQGEFAVHVHHCGSAAQDAAHRVMDSLAPLIAKAKPVN